MKKACLLLLLMTTVAHAQQIPTEEQKKSALMKAYRLNGNSMKGWGSIDLSNEVDPGMECTVQYGASTGKTFFDCPQPKSVKTEKVTPKKSAP